MKLHKFREIMVHYFCGQDPISKVSCDVLLGSRERNRVDPSIKFHKLIFL